MTPDKKTILKNLHMFKSSWKASIDNICHKKEVDDVFKTLKNSSMQDAFRVFQFLQELLNRNEWFHRTITNNRVLKQNTMSVPLANSALKNVVRSHNMKFCGVKGQPGVVGTKR